MTATPQNRKRVNLALQGGGAHGAFTWGVLDQFLADERLVIDGISGTSAGAMNAVVVADGLMKGGTAGARSALRGFWRGISDAALTSPLRRSPIDAFFGNWSLDHSPAYLMLDLINRLASPYELNPFNFNPVRDLLDELIDFETVRICDRINVFVSATNVETGRVKVFERSELTADMVMASACLPHVFQAVEIDGVPYWDGGYAGNPALFPFFYETDVNDIVVVQINPVERKGTPRTAREILNRVNEITFNSSLLKEFRAIEFVDRLIDAGRLDRASYKEILVHIVEGGDALKPLGASSKLNAEWNFLLHLFGAGQAAARNWIDLHFDAIGVRSTVDLRALFQGRESPSRMSAAKAAE